MRSVLSSRCCCCAQADLDDLERLGRSRFTAFPTWGGGSSVTKQGREADQTVRRLTRMLLLQPHGVRHPYRLSVSKPTHTLTCGYDPNGGPIWTRSKQRSDLAPVSVDSLIAHRAADWEVRVAQTVYGAADPGDARADGLTRSNRSQRVTVTATRIMQVGQVQTCLPRTQKLSAVVCPPV
jgi:hypothetical protein